jgi:hypothetical protein
MSCQDRDDDRNFAAPTEPLLNNIGPGCFIKVRDGKNCFWAEISSVNEGVFTGVVRSALATPKCQPKPSNTGIEIFAREQIVALGCDRYCWC